MVLSHRINLHAATIEQSGLPSPLPAIISVMSAVAHFSSFYAPGGWQVGIQFASIAVQVEAIYQRIDRELLYARKWLVRPAHDSAIPILSVESLQLSIRSACHETPNSTN
jgi:hypothetical protein